MKATLILLVILMSLGCQKKSTDQPKQKQNDQIFTGSVEKMDKELDNVINASARPEIIGEGFEWSEGPVWVNGHQFLLFSDIPVNTIFQWKEGEGITTYLKPAGYTGSKKRGGEMGSNGLILGQDGSLLLAQHGDRRIARMNSPLTQPKADFTTIAGTYQGKKLNSPNDLVMHSNGDIYFTDPPYGLEKGVKDPGRELDFQGVYRVDTEGNVTLLTKELSRPNGIAFSPDEKTLYVANSDPERAIWMAYDVQADGTLANGRVFYDATEFVGKEKGLPDGMKVDEEGYIYATGPGGVWIFNPDGRVLGKIKTGQATANCEIGNNGSTLYMTADRYLLRIPLVK